LRISRLVIVGASLPSQSERSKPSRYGFAVATVQRPLTSNAKTRWREVVHALHVPRSQPSNGSGDRRSLERLVDAAAQRITRFSAREAFAASTAGGVIVDIRSQDARDHHGVIPGSLHIPRTVLEWRIALDSPWRNLHLGGLDQELILICDHGYSSILAASNLVQLGFHRAADVIGGFEAWQGAGLPVARCRNRFADVGALPGTGPPE
jgi:rhodanese-related sulfurtransferase